MWCDCQGTINQPLFLLLLPLLLLPLSSPLSLKPKPRNACLNKLGAVQCAVHSSLLCIKLWRITRITCLEFAFLHFTVFVLVLAVHCTWQCEVCMEGKVHIAGGPCKGNVQKMALDLKNGTKNAFDLKNGHWRWSLCT